MGGMEDVHVGAVAPSAISGWGKLTSRLVVWLMALLMVAFLFAHRAIKNSDGRTFDEENDYFEYFRYDNIGVMAGSTWWDVLYLCCLWLPLAFIVVAALCLDRRGSNYVLDALDTRDPKKSSVAGTAGLENLRDGLWKARFVIGPKWARSVWSYGDMVVTTILVAANLYWVIGMCLKSMWEYWDDYYALEPQKERSLSVLYHFAFYAGWVGMMDAAAAVVFTVRENYLTKVVMGPEGGDYFHGIKYHVGLGYLTFFLFLFHGFAIGGIEIYHNGLNYAMNPTTGWLGHCDFWGTVALAALSLMVVTSLYVVRRKNYRLFFWTHQLYLLFLAAAVIHYPTAIYPIVGALMYFAYDRVAPRLNFSRRNKATFTRVSKEIVRLDIPAKRAVNQEYAPGDWINLRVASANLVNWHPFSIGSYWSATPDRFTLFMKARGTWTQKMVDIAPIVGESATVDVTVEGAFGARTRTYLKSDGLVVVGAGTGIAAVMPYALHFARVNPSKPVHVVWVARFWEEVGCYPEYLQLCRHEEEVGNFKVHLYLTRENSEAPATVDVTVSSDEVSRTPPSNAAENVTEDAREEKFVTEDKPDAALATGSDAGLQLTKLAVAVAVFGFGLFSYFWIMAAGASEIIVEGVDGMAPWEMCWWWGYELEDGSIGTLTARQKFECFYLNVTGLFFGALLGALAGLVVIFAYVHLHKSGNVTQPTAPKSIAREDATVRWEVGRPQLVKLFRDFGQNVAEGAHWMVMGAGPERLVREVENLAMHECAMTFQRESWKL